jgi:hypothetical protein
MKNMTRGIVLLFAAFAASAVYGAPTAPGVAGVDVFLKQNPSKRTMTDARGNFVLDALPPGRHTLGFRARKAQDTKTTTTDKVTVATTYSIKIEGAKRPVTQSGLTSESLISGVGIDVEVGSGAKIRGQVLAGATKQMVWIPKEPGSNIPGRWVEKGSAAAAASNSQVLSAEDLRDQMNRNTNMRDPLIRDPRLGQ